MEKMCSIGLGKRHICNNALICIVVVLGLLAVSGYADLSRSSDLILDARHEDVVWFVNTENCVERSVSSGVSLSSVWSGDLTFLRIERKVIVSYDERQEVLTPKKCENKTRNGTDDSSCFDVAYVNVTKYLIEWLPFDGAKATDLSAVSSGLKRNTRDVLSTAKSSKKSDSEEIIRFCFRTPDKVGQAHISYIAVSDLEYASDESTDVNITLQSLVWHLPTMVNNSFVADNFTAVNLSIVTDHIDSFLFNWNGVNYLVYNSSNKLLMSFNNNSAIGDSATTAVDVGSSSVNGTITGAVYQDGMFGKGLYFNGNNYVSVPTAGVGNYPKLTVMLWYNGTGGAGTLRGFFMHDDWASGYTHFQIVDTGKVLFLVHNSVPIYYSNYVFNSGNYGQWHHIAVTYDTVQKRLIYYIDGVLDSNYSLSTANQGSFSGGSIGSWYDGSSRSRYVTGMIDEFRVYDRVLSSDEIAGTYSSEFQKYNNTEYRFYTNLTNLSVGTYTYYGWANDTFGNSASSEKRTLTYDSSYPVVRLVTSNNTVWTTSSQVNFVYNVSQNLSGIGYCNLTVNDEVLNSSSNVTKNTDQTLYANLVNGVYTWSVNCTGQNGLMNWSTIYNISVATTTTTSTTTTTLASLCGIGLDCGSCTGWVYINATSGTLQALDGDENGKYDRVCCGGIVSNYAVL